MPPKRLNDKWLIGKLSSILQAEFENYLVLGDHDSMMTCLPFSGPQRLPTNGQVLKLYFVLRNSDKYALRSISELSELVSKLTIQYWNMANITTVELRTMKVKVTKLLGVYERLVKNKTMVNPAQVKMREDFVENMEKLFDIASPKAEQEMVKNRLLGNNDKEEDLKFLEDQRGERAGSIGVRDQQFDHAVQRKQERDADKRDRAEMEMKRKQDMTNNNQDENIEAGDTDDKDDDFLIPKPTKMKKSDTVVVEVPRNIFASPEVTGMLDRIKMTNNSAMGFFSTMMKASTVRGEQADLNEFTCSTSTIRRTRNKNRSVLYQLAMEEFTDNKPKDLNLHWDGKQMRSFLGDLEDYEAILVSGAPGYIEGKLLSVSKMKDEEGNNTSTGLAQFEVVKEQVLLWDVKDQIRSLTFDTTASNTGAHVGTCKRVEEWLGHPVMWFGCRHHVPELMAKAVWYTLFDEDLGPTNKFFDFVKNSWDEIDTSLPVTVLDGDLFNKQEALEFYREILSRRNKRNELTVRDDYRELVELGMLLLGEDPPGGMSWKKPGATHKARFCNFGIYICKALAFSDQLDIDNDNITKLTRVVTFLNTLYIPYFVSGSIGSDAPVNDLELFKKLVHFSSIDSELGDKAKAVLLRHTWYLQEETVPMALFSDKLPEDDKSRLACRILTHLPGKPVNWNTEEIGQDEVRYELGKPVLDLYLTKNTTLPDLTGIHSFMLFDLLGLSWEWLEDKPDMWEKSDSFQQMRDYVRTVKVTNDVAERGVKLMADYASILTADDDMRPLILQGVERNRRMFPNFKKSVLNS